MKIILILISLLSWSLLAGEIKIVLDKPSVLTGEIIAGSVSGYSGPVIKEKMLQDSVYVLYLDESKVDLVFLKRLSANTIALNDQDYLIWNPIDIQQIEKSDEVVLEEQFFNLKNNYWPLVLIVFLVILIVSSLIYIKKIKPRIVEKKKRKEIKDKIFAAEDNLEKITFVWKKKHEYFQVFPFIEEGFNKFEVTYYKYAFKPEMTEEEKQEILKSYRKMLEDIRGGQFGV